jgi:hypothetical protein
MIKKRVKTREGTYNHLTKVTKDDSKTFQRYCQVGITSSPPALMMLCIAAIAVTNSS